MSEEKQKKSESSLHIPVHMRTHHASKICAGKIKDPSGVKRKDFRGPKPKKAEGEEFVSWVVV